MALLRVTASRLTGRTPSGWYGRLPSTLALGVKRHSLHECWDTKRSLGTGAPVGEPITAFSQTRDGVVLRWLDRPKHPDSWSKYHYFWLRDNCQCPQCYHPETNQRLIDTLSVPLDGLTPRQVELTKESEVLRVQWEDGHLSVYPAAWLLENSYEGEGVGGVRSDTRGDVVLWGKEIADSPPEAEFSSVMEDDRELLECLKTVRKYGFCFIKGTPVSGSGTKKLLESMFGVLRSSIYGLSWDFTSDASDRDLMSNMATSDTAYTNLGIAAHTDGNYFTEAPCLEVFHCLHFEGTGGQSTLVDGFKIAQEIRTSSPEHFKILSTVPFAYHYTDKEYRLVNSNPSFVLDSQSGEVKRVHFNDADRLPLTSAQVESLEKLGLSGDVPPMQRLYEAIRVFIMTSRKESLVYRFRLEPGRLLLFNNLRLLHARTAFTGVRRMAGGYVDKEYYDSKLAVLSRKYNNY